MPTITIEITIPEGAQVTVAGLEAASESAHQAQDPVERYWREYLSPNGRKVYGAAARIEEFSGAGFSLEDIAENLHITYDSARSMHRSSGRSARKWRNENGSQEPIRLIVLNYGWDSGRSGMRTTYQLPDGLAPVIKQLDAQGI